MVKQIQFSVRGMAPVGGGRTRWVWRQRLRDAALAARPSGSISPSATFEMSLVFCLAPYQLATVDLDRLTAPVLDTLFASRDVQADPTLTGVLFPSVDDAAVVKLEARKVEATEPEHEGVDVQVAWRDADDS